MHLPDRPLEILPLSHRSIDLVLLPSVSKDPMHDMIRGWLQGYAQDKGLSAMVDNLESINADDLVCNAKVVVVTETSDHDATYELLQVSDISASMGHANRDNRQRDAGRLCLLAHSLLPTHIHFNMLKTRSITTVLTSEHVNRRSYR